MPIFTGRDPRRIAEPFAQRTVDALFRVRGAHTPPIRQAEITECGLAALAMLLGYHGAHVTLEEMRLAVGSTRLGVSAATLIDIAQQYGFDLRLTRAEVEDIRATGLPLIAHCRFIHFVVIEDINADEVLANDPAIGPVRIPIDEFSDDFTGVLLTLSPGPSAVACGRRLSFVGWFTDRLGGALPQLSGAAVMSCIAVGGAVAFASLVSRVLDRPVTRDVGAPAVVGLFVAAAVASIAGWIRDRGAVTAAGGVANGVSLRGLDRLSRLPDQFFINRLASQVVAKLGASREFVRHWYIVAAGIDSIGVVAPCVVALWIDRQVGAVIAVTLAIELAAIVTAWSRRGVAIADGAGSAWPRIGFDSNVLARMEPHLVSGGESELFSRLSGQHASALNVALRAAIARIDFDAQRRVVALARPGLVIVAALSRVGRGLSSGEVLELLMLALIASAPLNRLARIVGARGLQAAIHQVVDLEHARTRTQAEAPAIESKSGLFLNDVGWRPASQQRFVFVNLRTRVVKGAQLGITGRPSSGKSVMAQLLCGFLDATQGSVLLDGKPPRGSALLVAGRGPWLAGTVRENLLLGTAIPDRRLQQALADVRLDAELSDRGGLDLYLGQAGFELSSGQQRRLEIARALLRSPGLLVIDEALDCVNLEVEGFIRESIRRRGVTLALVSGRTESLAQCDVLVDMDSFSSSRG